MTEFIINELPDGWEVVVTAPNQNCLLLKMIAPGRRPFVMSRHVDLVIPANGLQSTVSVHNSLVLDALRNMKSRIQTALQNRTRLAGG